MTNLIVSKKIIIFGILCNSLERRRRWSGSSKGMSVDEADGTLLEDEDDDAAEDPKLKVRRTKLNNL